MIRTTGEAQRASAAEEVPDIAADLAEVVLDPPDRTIIDRGVLDLDGREVHLTYLGRGHTDNDIVVTIPDADVLCAGDLVENGAPPWFGDGFPMDWPATAEALLELVGDRTVVVPGHGAHADRAFVERSLSEIRAIADLALTVQRGDRRWTTRSPRRPIRRPRRASRSSGRWPSFEASSRPDRPAPGAPTPRRAPPSGPGPRR